jgi:polyhydroxybutyrate depolymerase
LPTICDHGWNGKKANRGRDDGRRAAVLPGLSARDGRRALVLPGLSAVVTASLVLSACGGTGSGVPGPTSSAGQKASSTTASSSAGQGTSTQASAVPASPSTGCGTPAVPGTTTLMPAVDGRSRTAIVHVPSGYHPGTPVALMVNMHGSQSTAQNQVAFTGMDAMADADTFIVVYPQADIPAGNGYEWNVPGQPLFGGSAVPATAPDDVSFIQQLVNILEQKYCIDRNRVFATGFSGGARMASQLGCDASTVFAAIAPVSGLRFPSPCASSRPMPVLSFHGTADLVDPYNGNGQAYWTYSVPVAAERWAAHDQCGPGRATSHPASGVTVSAYVGCAAGTAVQLYTINGEGHEWPGGPHLSSAVTGVLGPQTTAVNANATMWSFFMAHPL